MHIGALEFPFSLDVNIFLNKRKNNSTSQNKQSQKKNQKYRCSL